MKKKFILSLCLLFFVSGTAFAYSKNLNPDLVDAIKLYKAGNYTECYEQLKTVIKNDPANALGYYYLAMTYTNLGNKEEAIANYDKAIMLAPENNNLTRYAKKGKRCLISPDKCSETLYDSIDEEFIRRKGGSSITEQVQSDYERLKIENFMREFNRSNDIDPKKFKEYRDFSSYNSTGAPSDSEIVAAIRTLERAGLGGLVNNKLSDVSLLTGNSQQDSMLNMFGSETLNPQLIQALLTNNMSQGF